MTILFSINWIRPKENVGCGISLYWRTLLLQASYQVTLCSPGKPGVTLCPRGPPWGRFHHWDNEHHGRHFEPDWQGRWRPGSELVLNWANRTQVSHDWRVAQSEGSLPGSVRKPATGNYSLVTSVPVACMQMCPTSLGFMRARNRPVLGNILATFTVLNNFLCCKQLWTTFTSQSNFLEQNFAVV